MCAPPPRSGTGSPPGRRQVPPRNRRPFGIRSPALARPGKLREEVPELVRLLDDAAAVVRDGAGVELRAACDVTVRRPHRHPAETVPAHEREQPARVVDRDAVGRLVVLPDHRCRAELVPHVVRAQAYAGAPVRAVDLAECCVERARGCVDHVDVAHAARPVVHGHEVHAGQVHVRREHRRHDAEPGIGEPVRCDGKGEPHRKLAPVQAGPILQLLDDTCPARVRGLVGEGVALDVEVDRRELVVVDHEVIRVAKGVLVLAAERELLVRTSTERDDDVSAALPHASDPPVEIQRRGRAVDVVRGPPRRRACIAAARDDEAQHSVPAGLTPGSSKWNCGTAVVSTYGANHASVTAGRSKSRSWFLTARAPPPAIVTTTTKANASRVSERRRLAPRGRSVSAHRSLSARFFSARLPLPRNITIPRSHRRARTARPLNVCLNLELPAGKSDSVWLY